ncbi:MAG TPA: hypothetical protein PLY59_07815, partial [Clostridiales bacterium]|nr:hypothetical protein [Clostridiales bacterium]
ESNKIIETQRQEIEKLKATLADWKYEVKCHMDEVVARDKEIEKLRAQVARMRDALTVANNYMPDIGQFCAETKELAAASATGDYDNMMKELAHVAAVAIGAMEALMRAKAQEGGDLDA